MKWLAKPILWLLTSAIPVFIAACYGCPNGECGGPGDAGVFIKGKVTNSAGQGIPDIQVSCMTGDADAGATASVIAYSMAGDGAYSLEVPQLSDCNFLRFDDVDGVENGSFQSVDASINGAVEIEVVMDETE